MMTRDVETYFLDGCGRCKLGGTPDCKVHTWADPLRIFREIVLDCGLTEECKWGMPCYTVNGKNVLLIAAFKEYCSLNFFKGSLISDPYNLLSKAGENSEASRMLKTITTSHILENIDAIKDIVFQAIEIEKAGLKTVTKSIDSYPVPEEFELLLTNNSQLKNAYDALTPGRQKSYLMHFNSAKQSQTRIGRIEKCIPSILAGKGHNER